MPLQFYIIIFTKHIKPPLEFCFSSILTIALLGLLIYALLQRSQFPLVGRLLPLVCLAGIYVAWFPQSTSDVASSPTSVR